MSDQTASVALQLQTNEAIAAAQKNYLKLIERIGNIIKQNHSYFVTLGALIANQIITGDHPHNLVNIDTSFPGFINSAITLQLNSVDLALDECLKAFNINNSTIIKSIETPEK